MELHRKAEMTRSIDLLIESGKLNQPVYLFGHCNTTEETIDYLLEKQIAVTAILDNNETKISNNYRNIPIIPVSSVQQISITLIANRFFEPMKSQLLSLGYDGEIIKVVDYNTFAEYSLSDNTIKRKTARMERGAKTLENIRKKYPQHYLIICPHKALGDVYWACAYLPPYCAKNNINDVMVVVVGGGCCQVAEIFGHKPIVLEFAEMDEFVQAVIFTHEPNCIIAHHDKPYTDNIIKYLNKHFLSFTDYYKYAVYGLDKTAQAVSPTVLDEFNNKELLVKGKSLIISLYAKSVVQPPDEFWHKVIEEYKCYAIFTNVVGNEKPFDNTQPINIPLNQMISAVEYAGSFIGLRSGLCDIISSAKCNKTVVLPNCIYSTTKFKVAEFFAMSGWNSMIYCLDGKRTRGNIS